MDDFFTREYLTVIRQFSEEEVQQSLLRESTITRVCTKDPSQLPPSAPVSDDLPRELAFLGGSLCDLGFDKLNLAPSDIQKLYMAFCGKGVIVPESPYRLRHSVMSLFTFVEPATGHEATLPANWRQTVRSRRWIGKKVVADDVDLSYTLQGNVFSYIGTRVRRNDQLPPGFEPANDPTYKDVGHGHVKI